MANSGSFIVDAKGIHIDWGIERNGRARISGEGYIKIPISEAKRLGLFNVNHMGKDMLGVNLFHGKFLDGFMKDENFLFKTAGNSGKNSVNYEYAKNLEGNNNLKLIGSWFNHLGITPNMAPNIRVQVTVISPDTIQLEII